MQQENKVSRQRGLAFKMILFIFASLALVFVIVLGYNYTVTKKIVEKNIKSRAEFLTKSTIGKIDEVLSTIQRIPDNFVWIFQQPGCSDDQIKAYLQMMVKNNKEIYGAGIFFEPFYQDQKEKYYSFYYYRDKDSVKFMNLGNSDYDYFTRDWYMIPRELKKPLWSEPYFDEGGVNIALTTYSYPLIMRKNGNPVFAGVLTVDVSLDWLQKFVNEIKIYETGYGFMISKSGSIVTHPRKELILNETVFSIADEEKSPQLREIGRKMIHGESSYAEQEFRNIVTGKRSWFAYAPIPLNGWSVALVFPVEEFMADVTRLNKTVIFLSVGGLVIILLVLILISRSVTRPLRLLTTAAEEFAKGNFDVTLPDIRSKDEIGRLNASFIFMQHTLASTIRDLRETSEQLKISNAKLEEYSQTLEQKVEERTADLKAAQVQLVQNEKMASLGQLTAGIAHEIKNPLNFVNNFSELTIDLARELAEEIAKVADHLDEKSMSSLQELLTDIEGNARKINDHGKRADSIVRGMLLHSRGKAGDRQLTDINGLLGEYVNLGYHGMRATDNTFNVKIDTDYDQSIGIINVVPQEISRVFLNIINNAFYSTAQKKKELKDAYFPVLAVSTKDLGDRVEIRIRDNGKGIPKEITDKIFNPFFTTKPAGSGTGLGLSLSFDIIVHQHKGELKVDSTAGEFAEFTIILPK